MRTLPKGAASGLVRAVLPKSGAFHAAMTLLMLFRFNLSGRLAALTLMNIGILSGLSIDNHSLPCVYHHLQLSMTSSPGASCRSLL